MPYGIAAMSAGKVVAPLLSKFELYVQGWELLFMGSLGLTLLGLLIFICLYRVPLPEEAPLLPGDRHTESQEERPTLAAAEQGEISPSHKRLEDVSGYFDSNKQQQNEQDER